MFSQVVTEFWDRTFTAATPAADDGACTVVLAPHLAGGVALLATPGDRVRVALTPEVAESTGLSAETQPLVQLHRRLGATGLSLDDSAVLHYLPEQDRAALLSQAPAAQVRRLTAADADLFTALVAACSPADLDEAEVALDDWDVLGVVSDGALTAVASAYLWADSQIADLGVITHPEHRGQGRARALVRAFCGRLVAIGYEPQYRCDPENLASAAVARSAGLAAFGTWATPSDD